MEVQFEEKTYESYFNNELDKKSSIYFPPGQVLEGVLGFDASAQTSDRKLWKLLGYPFWFYPDFDGVKLKDIASELENILDHVTSRIPDIKSNLFIQYKRPVYITTANGKEWNHWSEAYFRYSIYEEQHKILSDIDQKFGEEALILYSSPAISTLEELIECKKKNTIIEKSNFKRSRDLNNHSKNTYIKSGSYSIACSEPEKIDNLDILVALENIESKQEESTRQNIIYTSNVISGILSENKTYKNSFSMLIEDLLEFKEFHLLYAHLVMKIFREITGVQWLQALKA